MFSLINKKVIGVLSSEVKKFKPRMEKSEVIQKKKLRCMRVFRCKNVKRKFGI